MSVSFKLEVTRDTIDPFRPSSMLKLVTFVDLFLKSAHFHGRH